MTSPDFSNILTGYTIKPDGVFGLRIPPTSGASSNHKGVDLSAPEGTAILSPYNGVVLISGYSNTAGNWLVLQNTMPDGTVVLTVFMHMLNDPRLDPNLQVGKPVAAGYEIGQVGHSGAHVTGNHLHYQEMLGSSYSTAIPVDPSLNWFGLTQGTAATPDAGTGMNIPGQTPDPTVVYRKAYASDGTVWLLYNNGDTFHYSSTYEQWTLPASDGSYTTITRELYNAFTPAAFYGAWDTQNYASNGTPALPSSVTGAKAFLALLSGDKPGNPFLNGTFAATSDATSLATATGNSSYLSLSNQAITDATGNTQTFTLYASGASTTDQIIQLALQGSGANKYVCTGANTISFANGPVNVTIPAGQDSVTVTLIDANNTSTADTLNLTATQVDPNAPAGSTPITSNTLAVTFNNPNPNVPGTAANTLNGDLTPTQYTDATGNLYYKTDAHGNLITGGPSNPNYNDVLYGDGGNDVINTGGGINIVNGMGGNDTINGGPGNDIILGGDMNPGNQVPGNVTYTGTQIGLDPTPNTYTNNGGNGNNLINGGGGQDIIIVGGGNNQIYANTQIDLATALTNQATATASTQKGDLIAVGKGDNTIVGGSGNDAIFTGTGNNTLVLGPGSVTVQGGVDINSASLSWYTSLDAAGNTIFNSVSGQNAPFNAPVPYHGSIFGGIPVGMGNDTIYGGKGNSTYWLSNGNNWLDAGGGNDYINLELIKRRKHEAANDADFNEGRRAA